MKRIRSQRWTGQLLSSPARSCVHRQRQFSQVAEAPRHRSTAEILREKESLESDAVTKPDNSIPPSPSLKAASRSAKLAALHARLALSQKLPIHTLARTLVDSSADKSRDFNNASLAQLGSSILAYHVSEWLICTYPRLPMAVLFSAMTAYAGPATLMKIGSEWGVETAAAPGGEVDPGLLQFSKVKPGTEFQKGGSLRKDKNFFRRGLTSRLAYDDEFGDVLPAEKPVDTSTTAYAYAQFVRALVGATYLHAGRDAAKSFIKAHILSRNLPIAKLFEMKYATRDLSRLCAREDFERPIARLLSETGRHSRHPVYVVGIFSGEEKLGEGAGPSLDEARTRAAHACLKAWYLYSPQSSRVPSDMEGEETRAPWEPVHIDIGEIVA